MATAEEERIAELEMKVRELEALTRGLTDEMLDLKSIVMKLNAQSEERRSASPARAVVARREVPASEAPAEATSLEMIMQPDGTLKPERRTAENVIVASGRFRAGSLKGGKGKEESAPLIFATEDDATTDDAVVIKKKK